MKYKNNNNLLKSATEARAEMLCANPTVLKQEAFKHATRDGIRILREEIAPMIQSCIDRGSNIFSRIWLDDEDKEFIDNYNHLSDFYIIITKCNIMKFIQPSVEYWSQEAGMEGVWKQIARATRISYQSKQKEGESDLDFVKRVIFKPALIEGDLNDLQHCKFDFNKMHGSVLEQGTAYLYYPLSDSRALFYEIIENPYNKVAYDEDGNALITSNIRYIIENNKYDILKEYGCKVPSILHPKRYTFNVITDIGVTREGNRHRKNSLEEQDFSTVEESTRYNSYDKGKYNGELKYILPTWVEENSPMKAFEGLDKEQQLQIFKDWCSDISKGEISNWDALSYYMFALKAAEFAYMGIRHNDNDTWTAEKARQVLNLNTKTNVVWTAYAEDWKHFLALRSSQAVSGTPHPNIRIIADKIAEIAKEQKLW